MDPRSADIGGLSVVQAALFDEQSDLLAGGRAIARGSIFRADAPKWPNPGKMGATLKSKMEKTGCRDCQGQGEVDALEIWAKGEAEAQKIRAAGQAEL